MHQTLAYDAVQAGIERYGKRHGSAKAATALPQAALISLDARTGAIEAMVGGTDFSTNRYNHATQAQRQPGSTFKPFVYSAALERGISPGTLINDAPLDNSPRWQPSNDDGRFVGPITVRQALAESRNLPAIRTLQAIGIPYAIDFAGKFGFATKRLPPYLPMALGTGTTSPLRLAAAYGVFANQGHRIEPYLIEKITDGDGNVLFAADTAEPPRVISERNAFVMNSLLQSVVDEGTGTDVAGKTGTTNDSVDGWFAGYAGQVVTVAWMGFDDNRSLGRHEFGATTALPVWAAYMEGRLAGVPDAGFATPPQLAQFNNDWAYAENADGTHGLASLGFPPPPAASDLPADGGMPGAPVSTSPTPTPTGLDVPASTNAPRAGGAAL
jgi:penicillin-binding protein 1A